ncbi:MAG: ATP-binding cassette domain-containing protein [bacterium]
MSLPQNALPRDCIFAQNLTFTYPGQEQPALADLSCSIKEGEFIVVIGPNGCGKSTLALLLAGLLTLSAGSLSVLGMDLTTLAGRNALRGRVGIVFQSPDEQMVATTVEREIAFGPENLGVPPAEIRRRVDELMEFFQLKPFARRSPHLLSGGEKQRLALASVLAMQPQLLILDEVTSLLDPLNRRKARQYVEELSRRCTVVLISQFPEEALSADRVLLMQSDGSYVTASPDELFLSAHFAENPDLEIPLIYRLLKAAKGLDKSSESD